MLKGITGKMGFMSLTEVQRQAIPQFMTNRRKDVVFKAKTGTGKTIAYLIACLDPKSHSSSKGVSTLILVPNRELGSQVEKVAVDLLHYADDVSVVSLIGGSSKADDINKMKRFRPKLLIATPGRLLDHITSTVGFSALLAQLQTLVLDEADTLLSQGLEVQLQSILKHLPKSKRSILVSATINDQVKRACAILFKPSYTVIDCVTEGEPQTHASVDQQYILTPGLFLFPALVNALQGEKQKLPYSNKTIVFFPTAKSASFASALLGGKLGIANECLTGQTDRDERDDACKKFRRDPTGVLITTDVSARGLDYPDLSLVVNVFAPTTMDSYIHRVGRTARAGKSGRSLLLLHQVEKEFISRAGSLPIRQASVATLLTSSLEVTQKLSSWCGADASLLVHAEEAYMSLLSHFAMIGRSLKLSTEDQVQAASDFCVSSGMSEAPTVPDSFALKLASDMVRSRLSPEDVENT